MNCRRCHPEPLAFSQNSHYNGGPQGTALHAGEQRGIKPERAAAAAAAPAPAVPAPSLLVSGAVTITDQAAA